MCGAATAAGRDVLPRIAAKLKAAMASEVMKVEGSGADLAFARPMCNEYVVDLVDGKWVWIARAIGGGGQIVGDYEADIKRNLISTSAPIGRALIGKKLGASVEVATPKGARFYEVLKVEYV